MEDGIAARTLGGPRVLKVVLALLVAVAGLSLLAAGSARAALTVGSDLDSEGQVVPGCVLSTPPCTHLGVGNHDGSISPESSPVNGTVTRFSIRTGQTGQAESFTFRLGRLDPSGGFDGFGAGTGPTATVNTEAIHNFPANLPIAIGDMVGIDTEKTSAISDTECGTGGSFVTYFPTLDDGGTPREADANGGCELLVQATVDPDDDVTVGKVSLNKERGKGFQPLVVANLGEVALSGKGVKKKTVAAPGPSRVVIPIKAKGKAKKKLKKKGKVKLKAKFAYTPLGGDPNRFERTIKLKRNKGK